MSTTASRERGQRPRRGTESMRVLMTADTVGGVWTYALDLCRGLERHGVHVTLATMGPRPGAAQREEVRACRNVTLCESSYQLEWMADPWDDVDAAGAWLLDLERRVRPDVVQLNGYAHAVLPWSVPVLVVAHSCVLSWWRAVHGCDAPPVWDRYRSAVLHGLRAARVVVAPTRAMLAELAACYGELADARVIGNGRDAGLLPLGARDAFGRYARRDVLPRPLILAAGRVWDDAKNLGVLAAAAPLLKWPVHVAGSAVHPTGGRRPPAGVHHLGVLTPGALRGWQQRAGVFIHPALYEPFGLAPLEAALCRTALVLADIPSLREIWQDAAVFVPPTEPEAIAAAVNRLIDQPPAMARHAEAAYRRARGMTARHMARQYHDLYRELHVRTPARETVSCAS